MGAIRAGQGAQVRVASYPDTVFGARVALIAPAADPKSRTFQVRVRPEEADGRLRPGMFAQVSIVTEQRESVLTVPREAIVSRSGHSAIFVVRDGLAQERPVELGLASDGMVEVTSGLDEGEEVVTSGQAELHDGDRVSKG